MISRTVCGLPDETFINSNRVPLNEYDADHRLRGFFNLSEYDKESIRYNMEKKYNYDPSQFYYVAPTEANIKDSTYFRSPHYRLMKQYRLMENFEGGFMDSAQDMYSFNFMGYSGAFMLNRVSGGTPGSLFAKYKVTVQTDSPIEFVGVHFPDSFSIRDRKGVMYYFQEKEYSYHPYKCYNPLSGESGGLADIYNDTIPYVSSWYLTRIEIPGKGSISLSYKDNNKLCIYSGIFQARHDVEVEQGSPTFFSTVNYTVIAPKMLSAISTGKVDILFINDKTPRQDIKNDISKLDYIHVKTKDGNFVKKYKFGYSYFSTNFHSAYRPGYALKLDKIDEFSLNDNSSVPYRGFSYEGDGSLPWTDFDQDHWGYPNGKGNNSLCPGFTEFPTLTDADRSCDRELPKKGVLTAVIYPTGGRVEYEWESNTYSYIRGDRLSKNDASDREEVMYRDTICGLTGRGKKEITLNIQYPQSIKLYLNKYYFRLGEFLATWMDYSCDHIRDNCDNIFPRLVIRYLNQHNIEDNKTVIYLDEKSTRTLSEWNGTAVYHQYLEQAGMYKISLEYEDQIPDPQLKDKFDNPGMGLSMYGNIPVEYFSYREPQAPPGNAEALGGGLRIKEIRSLFSGDSVVKRYSYNINNEPLHSSGVLPDRPDYSALKYVRYYYDNWHYPPPTPFKLHTNYSSGFYRTPLGMPRVEYSYVSEQYIYPHSDPAGEMGAPHIDRYYTTTADDYEDFDEQGFSLQVPTSSRIRTSMAHHRGNLKRVSYCEMAGHYSFKNVYYDYQINDDMTQDYFAGGLFVIADFTRMAKNTEGYDYNSDYGMTKFRLVPYNKKLKKVREEYFSYSVTSEYSYLAERYHNGIYADLPLSVTHETSTGGKETVYYSYWKDLDNNFITDKVASEIRVRDGYIVDAKRNGYDLLGRLQQTATSSRLGELASAYPLGENLELTSGLEKLFDVPGPSYTYDAGGRILDIEYYFVPVASFLWGYGGSHPVAEFRGMTSVQVDNILRNTGLTRRDFLDNPSRTEEYLGRLRTALPAGSDVTTLTYRWLVGVVSETDSRGVTTYYNYDGYGRLKEIRDYNRYLMRKYTYNLKSR